VLYDRENRVLYVENQNELDTFPAKLGQDDITKLKKVILGSGLFTALVNLTKLPQLETVAFTSSRKQPTLTGSLPDLDYLSLNSKALFQCQEILRERRFGRLDVTQISEVLGVLQTVPIVVEKLVLSGVKNDVPMVAAPEVVSSLRLDGSRAHLLNLENIEKYSRLTTLNLSTFGGGIRNANSLKGLGMLENLALINIGDFDHFDWLESMGSLTAIHVRGASTNFLRGLKNAPSNITIHNWD
jgi:hypothetical protein